jgi:hypothetical protein
MTDRITAELDLARFSELLDTYGADPSRFPEADRTRAQALLARDAGARRLLTEARALADAFDAMPEPEPSAALQRAVAEIPLRHPQPARNLGWAGLLPFRSASRAALSAALIVLLGVLSGVWSADSESGAYEASADDWQDLAALTLAADLDQELEP